jgi:hypothetical protein
MNRINAGIFNKPGQSTAPPLIFEVGSSAIQVGAAICPGLGLPGIANKNPRCKNAGLFDWDNC